MESTCTDLSHKQTGAFSSLVLDYLGGQQPLKEFYEHPVSWEGMEASIEARSASNVDRSLLVNALRQQYTLTGIRPAVERNLQSLLDNNTFTVCTAHQPAIFTGTLYFVYKIIHTIRLADTLNNKYPGKHFVPVFYMGSEDADLDELGHIFLSGDTLRWETKQAGAVGRMQVKGLEPILHRIEGELSVLPYGPELVDLIRSCYSTGNIQEATFRLVDRLFADRGLLVVIPDNALLKRSMLEVFEDDLLHQTASSIVRNTIDRLSKHYKVQANPREVNLFYLQDGARDRIEKTGENEWSVVGKNIRFSREELLHHLREHPERFSPNVILRGLFQETILPNIAFIGGGGELAYWLELKDLFQHYGVPYPMLILRNSFLLVEEKWKLKLSKLRLDIGAMFQSEDAIINKIVTRETTNQLSLEAEIREAGAYYDRLKALTSSIDRSLEAHIESLKTRALSLIEALEKKLLRAEKRKYEAEKRQVHAVRQALFPKNNLQERVENFMPYYALYGPSFLDMLYDHSKAIEPAFGVVNMKQVDTPSKILQ